MRGWDAESIAQARTQLANTFGELEQVAGRAMGSEVLSTVAWGTHVQRTYVVYLNERRPLYGRFDTYLTGGDWKVLNITVHTDPAQVFPPDMLVAP
jgi:hypothetical protein